MARPLPYTRSAWSGHRETTVTLPLSGTALLLIDVINDLAYKGSEVLVTTGRTRGAAARTAPRQIQTLLKGKLADSTRLAFRHARRRRAAVSRSRATP